MRKRLFQVTFLFLLMFLLLFSQNIRGVSVAAADTETEQTGFAAPKYTLNATDGSRIATTSSEGETTVLIFGATNCSKTRSTIANISDSEWVDDDDIRVIFAECRFASKETLQNYAAAYSSSIAYCYDESDIIFRVMCDYASKWYNTPTNGGQTPLVFLIDKDNYVRKATEGIALTAAQLKADIDRISNPDLPSESPDQIVSPAGLCDDLAYRFQTINGDYVSTAAEGKTTVLIFGYTTCGNTKNTLASIANNSELVNRENTRIIFAELRGASKEETKTYSEQFNCDKITYCYDTDIYEDTSIYVASFKYAGIVQAENDTVTYPLIAYIDGNKRVRKITQGTQTADSIMNEIGQYTTASTPEVSLTPAASVTPTVPPSQTSIANVSGLKDAPSKNSIKLSWKKVSKADGYIIYQYKSSKWKQIASVKSSKASYTVAKLTAGTGYRFAVKAYVSQNNKKTLSKSYASVYTATKPAEVTFKTITNNNKVKLKWSKVKGATGYTVCYKTSSKGAWKTLKKTTGTSFTTKKLKSGKTYIFTVKAYKTYKGKTYTASFKTKRVTIKAK